MNELIAGVGRLDIDASKSNPSSDKSRPTVIIQRMVRGLLVRICALVPPHRFQTKMWRRARSWYTSGKLNECEKYQIAFVERITGYAWEKTNIRINLETGELLAKRCPMQSPDGFEWTEDFDGVARHRGDTIYFNLKFVCDSGGAQTRSLREVYHFVAGQLDHLVQGGGDNVLFINILDGDTCCKHMRMFAYLLAKPRYAERAFRVFVGDMHSFQKYWRRTLADPRPTFGSPLK